jgi:hypothetical protein
MQKPTNERVTRRRRRRYVGVGLGEDQVTEDMVMDSEHEGHLSNQDVKQSATTSYELEKK